MVSLLNKGVVWHSWNWKENWSSYNDYMANKVAVCTISSIVEVIRYWATSLPNRYMVLTSQL